MLRASPLVSKTTCKMSTSSSCKVTAGWRQWICEQTINSNNRPAVDTINQFRFNGSRAILSGPAGGVVGYAVTSWDNDTKQPIIGFDMGGTSTDVSRYAGSYEHVFESTTAGVTIQAPQVFFRGQLLYDHSLRIHMCLSWISIQWQPAEAPCCYLDRECLLSVPNRPARTPVRLVTEKEDP